MPRLFGNIGRSSRQQEYAQYDHGDAYGYEPVQPQHSSWRRVLSRKPKDSERRGYYEGEMPQYQYNDAQAYQGQNGPYRTTVEDYRDSRATESFEELNLSRTASPVPIVQRESSFTRIQDAFSDHGQPYTAASEMTAPVQYGTPYAPTGTIHHAGARHEPVIVNGSPREGMHADVSHAPLVRPVYGDEYSQSTDSADLPRGGRDMSLDEYPSVVVVVSRGRGGKKDTYYIIPGGAPVIFEDENGNELTRVGDFSGKYRPQPKRPIILQDEHGREIYRTGFDDHSSRSRSNDNLYQNEPRRDYTSREGSSRHKSSRHYDYDHGSSSSSTRHSSDNYRHGDRGYHRSHKSDYREDYHTIRSRDTPDVIYVDPSVMKQTSHRSGSDTYSRGRSSRKQYYDDENPRSCVADNPNIVHLDSHGRQSSHHSGSSGTSSQRRSEHRSRR